ncbi:MAG: ATP phosphoribosyltransferase regulatory subunit, partial [Paracoccaceae bacterium]
AEGVRALLGEGRWDESGDFTKGAGLSADQQEILMQFVSATDQIDQRLWDLREIAGVEDPKLKTLATGASLLSDPEMRQIAKSSDFGRLRNKIAIELLGEIVGSSITGAEGVVELDQIAALLDAQGYAPDRIMIDPGVVRGLGYYTGPVYEAELTFQITDEKGRPRNFGSVAGGGRYDDLVKRFTGQSVPATGVSIGVDRLLAALRAKGRVSADTSGPVVVTVMDRDRMADYMGMVTELRNAGIRAETYLGNPRNFGNQLKYADKRNSPIAVIQGGNEAATGTVILKDLILGAKIAQNATLEEWKDRPAQVEIPRTDLVAQVRRMLDAK